MDAAQPTLTEILDRTIASGDVSSLLTTLNRYLAGPVPYELRPAAQAVIDLAEPDGARNEEFQKALTALQKALASRREAEEATREIAEDPELLQEFLVEAREHLAGVESGILALRQDPGDTEALNATFRCFHSIKGLAGFMGASAIQELAHVTEDLLDLARSGKIEVSDNIAELILKAADELNRCLDKADTCQLRELSRCESELLAAIAAAAHTAAAAPVSPRESDKEPVHSTVPEGQAEDVQAAKIPAEATAPSIAQKKSTELSVVRVDTSKLEYLIDMVGELVIAESVVRNSDGLKESQDPLLSRNLTQLARVVQEVQKTSMSMRMVAVGSL
ncbi:MAG: Hpt domain-containing protein, partial [Acidobacteriota bacterium]|nr:Hpt domain-containing protein [Acidobacteriota bacterium]